MDNALLPDRARGAAALEQVAALAEHARGLIDASRAEATRRAYAADWADFERFCDGLGLNALPAAPQALALYLADLHNAERSVSTIERRVAAISVTHQEAGYEPPSRHVEVRKLMTGIRRTNGTARRGAKRALEPTELRRMVAQCDDSPSGRRDRALLLVGFIGGLRRSELVALDLADLTKNTEGYAATIRRSKTDQEGHGRTIALPYSASAELCPVAAIDAWREELDADSGALFVRVLRGGAVTDQRLSAQSVGLVVKKHAATAGLDRTADLGAHSLRSGFATAAAARGASERAIANQTGHRSMQTLRTYIQRSTTFDDNAATELGL